MASKGQHVIPSGGKWIVRRAGSLRASNTCNTYAEALSKATTIARNQGSGIFVHGKDGRIVRHIPVSKGGSKSK
ncbi:DUF2188 domain-containing protein [Minwuia thermotolerans]|uniref:DUF2188 domain-containing protein n=1 Tax=Minwuia thermotolerans TaxID=2056226 RepID=A0A2M9G4L2_9PROT|nr:hypothetical protein CVT23_05740 [Minwuia thermotolerans]